MRRRGSITPWHWGVPVLVLAAFGLGACGGGDGGGEEGAVHVTLQEFAVVPDSDSTEAGDVTFDVTNEGPDDTHEFVVIRTDLAPDALPTSADGSVDEEGEGVEVVDELEDVEVGDSRDLTIDLDAGSYVLICNVVEEDEGKTEAHYKLGMRTAFTVT